MGIEIVKDNTDEVMKKIDAGIERGLTAVGLQAASRAAEYAPKDTGRLRDSISSKVEGKSAVIGTDVEYAPYQEFGTSRGVTGKHYLKNAVWNHVEEYTRMIATFLKV